MTRRVLLVACTFLAGVLVTAGLAFGANPFVDIDSTGVHQANIIAIYEAGVTVGCDPTHYCPGNTVNRAQMATFLARLGGLGANFPKVNAKGPTQAYCALAAANPRSLEEGLCIPAIANVDATDNAGRYSNIAMGADGLPVIAYATRNVSGDILRVAHCENIACSDATLTTVNGDLDVGFYPSVAIGADGLPIIAYYRNGAGDLLVTHCGNAKCNAGNTTQTLDSTGDVGTQPSIAIGDDDLPVISYYDGAANMNLKVAHCVDVLCTPAGSALTTVDSTGDVGQFSSIAIGRNGFPVVAYYDATAKNLKVAACGNAACIGGTTFTTVDNNANDVGKHTSIAIGTDGFPIISYADVFSEAQATLKVAHCTSATCSTSDLRTPDPTRYSGYYSSIVIGTDGLPIIASLFGFIDVDAHHDVQITHCVDVACANPPGISTYDTANMSGFYASIAIGADGVPVVAYQEGSALDLKVARLPSA